MSMDELQAQGIGFDTLIYADGDAPALLDRSGKKLWRWQDGALVCTLDYAGTPMDLPQERYQAAVMQDGWLFLRAVPPEGTVYEADVYRADPLTGDAERLPLEGVTELCAWEGRSAGRRHCDVDSDVCRLVSVDPESGTVHTLDERSMQGIEGVACDGNTICAIVDARCPCGTARAGRRCRATRSAIWTTPLRWWARATRPLARTTCSTFPLRRRAACPRSPSAATSAQTTSTRISSRPIPAWPYRAPPTPRSRRGRWPRPSPPADETDLFHVRMDGELLALMRQGGLRR